MIVRTKNDILNKLSLLKKKYIVEGITILALFGSYAKNEQNSDSDIDILYDVNNDFIEKYQGFKAVSKILDIQNELSELFHAKIDFTSLTGLSKSIRDDIEGKAIYV